MCETKYLNKLQHFAKLLAKPFSTQNNSKSFSSVWEWCFSVNYNFTIIIIPE